MLVLTRKQSESIRIGDSITITVLRMKGKSVRLGIQAPHELTVIRGELAFDQDGEEEAVAEADEVEEPTFCESKSRACNNRPSLKGSWSAKSEHVSKLSATGALSTWSI
jgi:carbon storage regulator CsrA